MTGSHGILHPIRTALGTLTAFYVTVVYRTARLSTEPDNPKEYSAQLGPLIVASWHGQNMILPPFWHQKHPLEILVSRHRDAEFGAAAYRGLGLGVIRGSGSAPGRPKAEKGGAQAIRVMMRALQRGSSVALVADVPTGPSRRAGRGIIMLAQLSGKPILPVAVTTKFQIVANNWSRFAISLPFSKGSIAVGEPIYVPRDADETTLESKRQQLEDSLNAVTVTADTLVGRKPHYDAGGPVPKLNLSFQFYSLTTRLFSPLAPFLLKRRLARGKEEQGRTGEKLGISSQPRPAGTLVWLHAASVGEATSCLGLIDRLLSKRGDLNILVTTTTLTAAEIMAKRLPRRAFHQYAPLDLPKAIDRFLDYWHPDLAIFAESEIWPNSIVQLYCRKIPIALVNGRLSKRSYKRWRKVPGLIRLLLARFDHISAQSHEDDQRLAALGAYKTFCFGNMKADVTAAEVTQQTLRELKKQIGKRPIWLAASTHRGEEALVLECHHILKKAFPDILTLIVPRHRERADEISQIIEAHNFSGTRRSKGSAIGKSTGIYLADTLGELPLFYTLSPISFIGGSLVKVGGHNPIEAIDGGSVVVHGPYVENFKDIYRALDQQNGAIKAADSTELARQIGRLLNSRSEVETLATNGKAAVATLKGATGKTANALLKLLDK